MSLWSVEDRKEVFEGSEVVVRLATESNLSPLYIAPFYLDDPSFDGLYLREIEKILRFDLQYNGYTQVVAHSQERKNQVTKETFDGYYDREAWRAMNVEYVVKIRIRQRKLSASIFSVKDYSLKSINEIPLSGEIPLDRRRIHQLTESIHKAFFSSFGVTTTKILYTVKLRQQTMDSTKWTSEVWECDYDGGNARQITHEGRFCVSPIYVPPELGFSSGSFFYVSYRMGQPKIFVASLRDGEGRRFSYLRGNQLMPVISFQRDRVAFICDVAGNADVFLQSYSPRMGALGKPRQIFTAFRGTQASPTLSPDGDRIAFVSDKDGVPRIYAMDIPPVGAALEEIRPALITKQNRESTSPAWSPDGTKIVYSAKTEGIRQIWVYDFMTDQEKQLTYGGNQHRENPSWAPDSLHVVFNAGDEKNSELYLLNLNQQEVVNISLGKGEKRFPSWEPRFE